MISRERAIEIAQACAFAKHDSHNYLPKTVEAARKWQPHEWVIDAIRTAYCEAPLTPPPATTYSRNDPFGPDGVFGPCEKADKAYADAWGGWST